MARLVVDGNDLVVRLSLLEKLGAFAAHNPRVPLMAVQIARVAEDPWRDLRGMRAPGTGLPGVIMLGTTRGRGVHDFAAVYGHRRGVVVELKGASPWTRFVISCRDDAPEDVVAAISGRTG
jgi:hypothetical protein